MKNIKKILSTIAYNEPGTIRAYVAEEALGEDPDYRVDFFRDLAHYGCVTGMVSSLIYYCDTHKFFDTFYYEIMEMLENFHNEGIPFKCTGEDLKNRLAWLSFEQVAWNMAQQDLGLDC